MVKVLCLHGVGANADILESQTTSLRSFLPDHYEYQFIDGEQECAPAPGADGVFPPPFSCYFLEASTENIQEAVDFIDEIVESEGPFDGVIGFSQGASLAATILLRHQILHPYKPLPFRIAVFLCTQLPWSWSTEYGYDVTNLWMTGRGRSTNFEEWQVASLSAPTVDNTQAYLTGLPEGVKQQIRARASMLRDAEIPKFHRFHPMNTQERIAIPTVHLCGSTDPDFESGMTLVDLCNKNTSQVIEHPGGHEMPRDRGLTQAIAEAIQRAMTLAELGI